MNDPLLAALAVLAAVYAGCALAGPRRGRSLRAGSYYAGIAVLGVALLGPPDTLNRALFSAHMTQHLLLTLVAPPLLVCGAPWLVVSRAVAARWLGAARRLARVGKSVGSILGSSGSLLVALVLSNAILVLWHVPSLYQVALEDPLIHQIEHGSLFWSALLFWWLVGGQARRSSNLTGVLLALFASWMVSDLIGAALALSPNLLYPVYGYAGPWGINPLDDQRHGGLLMWLGGGGFYAACMVAVLVRPYTSHPSRP